MSASRPTIAAAAIARNEAVDLPGFLANVAHFADEIILIDDGSDDDTVAIARAFTGPRGQTVKVIEHPMDPETGFAGQRNLASEHATADWLLHMDVDERVTPALAASLAAAAQDLARNGFRYRRLNFFLQHPLRRGGWQHWNRPQFARRGAHRFVNRVHEECVIDGGDAAIGQLTGWMWHLNDADYVERVSKNLQYMQLTADQIMARGTRVRWYHLVLHPLYRALRSYLWEGGFREGTRGVVFAGYTAISVFNWWACAWDRQGRPERAQLEAQLEAQWQEAATGDSETSP